VPGTRDYWPNPANLSLLASFFYNYQQLMCCTKNYSSEQKYSIYGRFALNDHRRSRDYGLTNSRHGTPSSEHLESLCSVRSRRLCLPLRVYCLCCGRCILAIVLAQWPWWRPPRSILFLMVGLGTPRTCVSIYLVFLRIH